MFVACSLAALAPCSLVEALAMVRDAGLKRVAVSWPDPRVTQSDFANFATLLAEQDLRVAAVDCGLLPDDDAQFTRWSEAMLHVAAQWQAEVLIVTLATLEQPAVARLRSFADAAAGQNAIVALETAPGPCANSRGMLATLVAIEHPAVRLCFDTGKYLALNSSSSGEVALQRVCGQLGCVRLRDAALDAQPVGYPPLGQGGSVDFARTLEILRPLQFRRPCLLDFALTGRRPASPAAIRAALLESVAKLRSGGWFD